MNADTKNIAETLHEILPRASLVLANNDDNLTQNRGVYHVAVPKAMDLKEIDLERLLPAPRRAKGTFTASEASGFLDFVKRYARPESAVWCNFSPMSSALAFAAVINEHNDEPGWRDLRGGFTPTLSPEWVGWTANNGRAMAQEEFARFIESHAEDIFAEDGLPTDLQMLAMATEFEANSDKRFKSVVRLQGGGVEVQYLDSENSATITKMKAFERFRIAIPVFFGAGAKHYKLDARLKYRHGGGKVSFWFELIRPERVHEAAARELIGAIREGLGDVPLILGTM